AFPKRPVGCRLLAIGALTGGVERGRRRLDLRRLAGCRLARNRDAGGHDWLAVRPHGSWDRLGVGPRIGRIEIDDVAQVDLALVELVAPDDDGLERQRTLAQARDHRLAAGLDALGDRDLAFAREQIHRAHFTKIDAHGVVGALARLLGLWLGRYPLLDLDQFATLSFRPVLALLRRLLSLLAR